MCKFYLLRFVVFSSFFGTLFVLPLFVDDAQKQGRNFYILTNRKIAKNPPFAESKIVRFSADLPYFS